MSESEKSNWIRDELGVWDYDGKLVQIFSDEEDKGIHKLHVVYTDENGHTNPGFVMVYAEPLVNSSECPKEGV